MRWKIVYEQRKVQVMFNLCCFIALCWIDGDDDYEDDDDDDINININNNNVDLVKQPYCKARFSNKLLCSARKYTIIMDFGIS